jgi:UDP-N-acetylglucosamine diphosphorylase/glucosamine-1-phosphate N-acetyltransferase
MDDTASIEHAVLNASTGPIYIGKNVVIMEGSYIRGPFAIGDNSTIKMGTRIYGATTAGPNCVLGGEIKNSVIFGNSNKAHDGYMGDSVIGEWCNWGAGTSNSNVKNTASDINVSDFNMETKHIIEKKCGVIMGDYSRTSINTSINTGSFFGLCCNIFGEGLLPKHISNFSWGVKERKHYEFDKAIKDISNWMQLKNTNITRQQIEVLKHIFEHFSKQ